MNDEQHIDAEKQAHHDRWHLAVMWVLVAAFLVALPMMFVHPAMTLALFWIGLCIIMVPAMIVQIVAHIRGSAS